MPKNDLNGSIKVLLFGAKAKLKAKNHLKVSDTQVFDAWFSGLFLCMFGSERMSDI